VARVLRNGQTESWHYGAAAVVTPYGGLVARIGDSAVATFLRSAAKPFQVLPLLAAGGRERFELSDADLALICASHSATPAHVERVESLLERGGFSVDDLQCGAHPPLDEAAAAALAANGTAPSPLHNNCSGKHAGKLLACRLLDLPTDGYLERDHPLQESIRDWLSLFCGLPLRVIGHALDGCSAPTFCLPLQAAARAYAALADPGQAAVTPEGAMLAGQVVSAMTGHPEMVAGPGRFTTRLMEVTGGRVLGKEGFEGFYGLAVRGPVALGVALKIADGSARCRDGVVLDLLRQLGSLSAAELAELTDFHQPKRHNVRGTEVGEIVPDLAVEEA
jgi:L-asparaginase II